MHQNKASRMRAWAHRLVVPTRSDRGASLVEYALLIGLIAVVCIVAITFLGTAASESFSENSSSMFTG